MRKLTKEDMNDIFNLYENGKSMAEIARLYQTTRQNIWYHLKQADRLISKPDPQLLINEALKQLEMEGKSLSQRNVAATSGLALSTVSRFYRRPTIAEQLDIPELIKFYIVNDKSLSEISIYLGNISVGTLTEALKAYGVPIRPKGSASGELRQKWREKALRWYDANRGNFTRN